MATYVSHAISLAMAKQEQSRQKHTPIKKSETFSITMTQLYMCLCLYVCLSQRVKMLTWYFKGKYEDKLPWYTQMTCH